MTRIARWSLRGGALVLALLAALAAAAQLVSRPLFTERLETATLHSVAVATPDMALTLARYHDGHQTCVLLVTAVTDGLAEGVDACRHFGAPQPDPLALYAAQGYAALREAVLASAHRVRVPLDVLRMPYDAPADNIAIGANYVEHAREAQVAEQPFVFPKRVWPTVSAAPVPRGDSRRLDYEVELGFVALTDLTAQTAGLPLGLVLVNDFTDRWSLVRHFDGDLKMGQTGFVDGKSREGYAPIGDLLVIPRDPESFYRDIELSLYVNGRLRQRERAGRMVWGPREMIAETLHRENWTFHGHGGTVPLLPQPGTLPRGTLILSGTPAGVIFKPVNLWAWWLYLQPGDEVVASADALGALRNRIVR
jgi:2,4-didehydro-3-deoxy-L-rhamnonate hydrolase